MKLDTLEIEELLMRSIHSANLNLDAFNLVIIHKSGELDGLIVSSKILSTLDKQL
jgi:hypothetical protein